MSDRIIYNPEDKKYHVYLLIQDGTEHWAEDTESNARDSWIHGQRVMNGNYKEYYQIPKTEYIKSKDDRLNDLEVKVAKLERIIKDGRKNKSRPTNRKTQKSTR